MITVARAADLLSARCMINQSSFSSRIKARSDKSEYCEPECIAAELFPLGKVVVTSSKQT
jgi:hypothetical protein